MSNRDKRRQQAAKVRQIGKPMSSIRPQGGSQMIVGSRSAVHDI
jgi:hypothetical protein